MIYLKNRVLSAKWTNMFINSYLTNRFSKIQITLKCFNILNIYASNKCYTWSFIIWVSSMIKLDLKTLNVYENIYWDDYKRNAY